VSGTSGAPLAFEGISFEIDGRTILRDVDLAVEPGEILVLAGSNGAGKTTLLRIASRVLQPSAGRVLIRGRDSEELSRRALARAVAVVPQDVQVAFPFRAGEVVLMGRAPHLGVFGYESRSDVSLARAAMERVGIADLADRSILELSGGERQLVLIARALAQDPEVLLLDEPTAHLDLRHRIQVLSLVREFAAAGRSALVVSHDLTLAARSCDRIGLLAGGGLLAVGAPDRVLTVENLQRAFGIDAEIVVGPDGAPLVVPTF
jgi:iron complex transport system ATP-binding protein